MAGPGLDRASDASLRGESYESYGLVRGLETGMVYRLEYHE